MTMKKYLIWMACVTLFLYGGAAWLESLAPRPDGFMYAVASFFWFFWFIGFTAGSILVNALTNAAKWYEDVHKKG